MTHVHEVDKLSVIGIFTMTFSRHSIKYGGRISFSPSVVDRNLENSRILCIIRITENKRYIPIFKKIRKYATQIHMFQMLYKHLSPVGNETQLF